MSEAMDSVRHRARMNVNITPPVASLIIALADEIDDLHNTTRNQHERHESQAAALRKEIDKLKGVHGA